MIIMANGKNPLFDKNLIKKRIKETVISDSIYQKFLTEINPLIENESLITMNKNMGNEENVRIKVIVPILELLGYDTSKNLNFEESSYRGSIDVSIRASEESRNPDCLIEIKYWKKDLDKLRDIKEKNRYKSDIQQGLTYAVEKGIEWFIITNGFEWRLYKTFITGQIPYNFYEFFDLKLLKSQENFKKFYLLLSKESFSNKIQDSLFSDTVLVKEKVNDEIYGILTEDRTKLFKNIFQNNMDTLDVNKLMETGQKILDRFVFIRFAEDNGLFKEKLLKSYLEKWNNKHQRDKERNPLHIQINDLFYYIMNGSDDIFPYNGGLFEEDTLLENLKVDNEILEAIINSLYYYPDNDTYIDFSEIPLDILGHIYEKYLSLSLIIKEEGTDLILKENSTKEIRKKAGIFYTPKYIVHFIIEQTIKRILEENINKVTEIKILDPACGSGTFLSSAYDILYDTYVEYNKIIKAKSETDLKEDVWKYFEKMEDYKREFNTRILTNNLFGVDLNPESIEITKMSLWFKTIQQNISLDKLENNIKCGNSLIENINFSDNPFKWKEEFGNIYNGRDNQGFDIILGNPPYGAKLSAKEKRYFDKNYELSKIIKNSAILFIEKSFNLLKDGGILGLVLPKSLTFSQRWQLTRNYLLKNSQILEIVDVGKAFSGVKLEQIILICKKIENTEKTYLGKNLESNGKIIANQIPFHLIHKLDAIPMHINSTSLQLFEKISKSNFYFKNISKTFRGLPKKGIAEIEKKKDYEELLHGALIKPFFLKDTEYFVNINSSMLLKLNDKIELLRKPKIISQRIVAHVTNPIDHIYIMSTLDEKGKLNIETIENTILTDNNYNLKYLLGFLNSKLISWYTYYFIFNKAIRTMDFDDYYFGKVPIFPADKNQQATIIKIVEELLDSSKYYGQIKSNFGSEINKYPRIENVTLNYYYQKIPANNKKIKILSNLKGKIENLTIRELNDDIIYAIDYFDENKELQNECEVMILTVDDKYLRKFLIHSIRNVNVGKMSGNILKNILNTPIPLFDKNKGKNSEIIEQFIKNYLDVINEINKTENKIVNLEMRLNSEIYKLYGINQKEIQFIESLIGIESLILHLFP